MSRHPRAHQIRHLDTLYLELEFLGSLKTKPRPWVAPIITQAITLGNLDLAKEEIDRQRNILRQLKADLPKSKAIDMLGGVGHDLVPRELIRKKIPPRA